MLLAMYQTTTKARTKTPKTGEEGSMSYLTLDEIEKGEFL